MQKIEKQLYLMLSIIQGAYSKSTGRYNFREKIRQVNQKNVNFVCEGNRIH